MAKKKTKGFFIFLLLAVIVAVIVLKNKISTAMRGKGTWAIVGQGNLTLEDIKATYPGFTIDWSNHVTVTSRPDLTGVLTGDTITWNNGSKWVKV